jgi:putative heme-binding domain-containing protein
MSWITVLLALQDLVVKEDPLSATEQLKRFKLPPGFTIQLVAAEPDIAKPMNLSFDDRGRLYVTSSYEYPFPAKDGIPPRDAVKILEDFGPDGRAGKVSTFAGGLNIPIGLLALSDGALAHSIPKVWRFTDADGDGVAESRAALYGDVGLRDTHGMVNGFTPWLDGWIYACHGFANDSKIAPASGGTPLHMVSGNTWRFRADGSALQSYTKGQVNPFGMAVDPLGNFYTADCHSLPIYALLRGGNYPTFDGKHDGLGHAPSIMSHLHGSTAIGGIVWYSADQFPAKYRGTVFVGNPVTGRVNHDALEARGSSWKALEQPDFLRCDDKWFRPVDLKIAPDGTLYIADFYNRIIGHYEVPLTHPGRDRERGRIWRVVHTGEGAVPPRPMPDLAKADTATLIRLLEDPNLTVRVRAVQRLVERGAEGPVREAMTAGSASLLAHGLWVLERRGGIPRETVERLSTHADRLVRVHLLKALSERTPWTFEAELVRKALKDSDPYARRAAAEALGLHPDATNVGPLLELWNGTPAEDTHLVHMTRMALRDQLAAPGVLGRLGAPSPADRKRLLNVALGAASADAARFVLESLKAEFPDAGTLANALRHLVRNLPQESIDEAFTFLGAAESKSPRDRMAIYKAASQACQERGIPAPAAVGEGAAAAARAGLASKDGPTVAETLKFIRDLRPAGTYEGVEGLLSPDSPPEIRSAAIDALPQLDRSRAVAPLARIAGAATESTGVRQKAVAALAGIPTAEARKELLAILAGAPLGLGVQVAAAVAGNKDGAAALLAAVAEGKASPRLLADPAVQSRLRTTQAKDLIAKMEAVVKDLPPVDDRLLKLIQARKAAHPKSPRDVARGAEIFKKTCAGCHRIDGLGQKVGPELDAVYTRGLERLLEDVLDPNRNVDQAFRATLIKTADGRVISGLVKSEEGEVIVVQEAADKETRIAKKEVEARQLSALSPMPANVADPLSEEEFHDLMHFLLKNRGQK